jgi:hypothetical protein
MLVAKHKDPTHFRKIQSQKEFQQKKQIKTNKQILRKNIFLERKTNLRRTNNSSSEIKISEKKYSQKNWKIRETNIQMARPHTQIHMIQTNTKY